MKILLVGEVYSKNLGDQLVACCTQFMLKKIAPNADIVFVDIKGRLNHPSDEKPCSKKKKLKNIIRLFLSRINIIDCYLKQKSAVRLSSYYEAFCNNSEDCVALFAGGQIVSETFSAYIFKIASIFEKKKIPFYFCSVGMGILRRRDVLMYKDIFSMSFCKGISCRCHSLRFNDVFFDGSNIAVNLFDPVVISANVFKIERDKFSNLWGLGVMSSSRYKRRTLIDFWMGIIQQLDLRGIQWELFTTGDENDFTLAQDILKELNVNEENKLAKRPLLPEELLLQESKYEKIFSFRLHSHIVAYSLGIPSFGVCWDEKIKDFFEKTSRNDCIFNVSCSAKYIVEKIQLTKNDENEIFHKNILKRQEQCYRNMERIVEKWATNMANTKSTILNDSVVFS